MHDLIILGNGLAGLVAALELGRKGMSVALLSDGRPPGGHFLGMQVDGFDFDIGMVMLERYLPDQPCQDWSSFIPTRRQDWTRFGILIWNWMQTKTPLRRVPTPVCRVGGNWRPDYLIANRLDGLAHSNIKKAEYLSPNDPRHASRKLCDGPYDQLSYAEASELNHGVDFHARFIKPFVGKLIDGSSADILARWHRAVWAPLYYPETLNLSLEAEDHGLQEYPFWVPENGCISNWTRALHQAIDDCPQVTRLDLPLIEVTSKDQGWRAVTSDGQVWNSDKSFWSMTPARACELLHLPAPVQTSAASVSVQMCSIESKLVKTTWGCAMVVDEDHASYRITCPDLQAGLSPERLRFTIEANPQRLARQYPNLDGKEALQRELASLVGLSDPADVKIHRHLTVPNALSLPTNESIEQARQLHVRLVESTPNAWLSGNLLGHGLASINDQIAQALQITEVLNT